MTNSVKLTTAQCAEAMRGKDFGPEIRGAAELVAVVLTQGWCPQWKMMTFWLDAAVAAAGATFWATGAYRMCAITAAGSSSRRATTCQRTASWPTSSGKQHSAALQAPTAFSVSSIRSGTSCFLRDSTSLSSKVRSPSLGKRSIATNSLSPSTKRTLDSSVMSVTMSALK